MATKFPTPWIERDEPGLEVPMPILPLVLTTKMLWLDEVAIWKIFAPPPTVPLRTKLALGVEVPIPKLVPLKTRELLDVIVEPLK